MYTFTLLTGSFSTVFWYYLNNPVLDLKRSSASCIVHRKISNANISSVSKSMCRRKRCSQNVHIHTRNRITIKCILTLSQQPWVGFKIRKCVSFSTNKNFQNNSLRAILWRTWKTKSSSQNVYFWHSELIHFELYSEYITKTMCRTLIQRVIF